MLSLCIVHTTYSASCLIYITVPDPTHDDDDTHIHILYKKPFKARQFGRCMDPVGHSSGLAVCQNRPSNDGTECHSRR